MLTLNDVVPFLQPIVDCRTGDLIGAEILCRIHTASGYMLNQSYIDLLEVPEHADAYASHLLKETATQLGALGAQQNIPYGFIFSLNITSIQIRSPLLMAAAKEFQDAFNNNIKLRLEIVERHVTSIDEGTIDVIDIYNGMGISFAIDDFGVNKESLKYFGLNNVSMIKLESSFTAIYRNKLIYQELINAIVKISDACGVFIIAEGVENTIQEYLLKKSGIFYMQGFFYSKPVCLQDFSLFFHSKKNEVSIVR